MRILFLGDIVGSSGCDALKKNLPQIIKKKEIDFVIVNGENAADQGVGIQKKFVRKCLILELMLSLQEIMFGIKKKLYPTLKKKIDY